MAHALVHAADQDQDRQPGGEREVAEGRNAECEGDRHASEDERSHKPNEEEEEVVIAERTEERAGKVER